jgi:hypothetical protein
MNREAQSELRQQTMGNSEDPVVLEAPWLNLPP